MSNALKILSRPKGNAEEYGRWSVNPYLGCPHGCLYCYLKKGVWKNALGGSEPTLKRDIINETYVYHKAWCEILENKDQILQDGGLFMSFVTDPLCEGKPIFDRYHHEGIVRTLFLALAEGSARLGVPVTILTKSVGFRNHFHYKTISKREKDSFEDDVHNMVAFGWTLTGHDELEPNAPSNENRLREMTDVHNDGLKVWASIEPVIDFGASYSMIEKALSAGCQHFKIGLLTNNTRVVRKDFGFGKYKFNAYDLAEAVMFVEYVMTATAGRATVYWKQSFYDFFGNEPIHGMTAHEFLHHWPHSVDKDWSMFGKNKG